MDITRTAPDMVVRRPADQFAATAQKLSTLRFKTIDRLTLPEPSRLSAEQRLLRIAAIALRRASRGPSKLGRRLRRNAQLGMAGVF